MVSVVIPAYNAEKEIPSCLDSLLNQTFPKEQCEIIVVNDGSTDGTEKIVRKYDGVKIITQANQGPAAARNNGVSESKGDIIVFTDSDCVPEEDWLEEMLKPFNDTEVVGVQGAYKTKQKEVVARFAQIEIEERY
ncbi:glycosyltransferase family 2 protein, partial [bacterium]|nr:glycosyltransferase family 2 protein [bacterium]